MIVADDTIVVRRRKIAIATYMESATRVCSEALLRTAWEAFLLITTYTNYDTG